MKITTCSICGGDGRIEVQLRPRSYVQINPEFEMRDCADCDGTGRALTDDQKACL